LRAGSSGWRAVDDEGEVLDLLVQRRRDKAAVEKLMRKLLRKGVNIQSRNTPKGQFDLSITRDDCGRRTPRFRTTVVRSFGP
jgi:transposase-like protein